MGSGEGGEEQAEAAETLFDDVDVQEDLKDSVEGSLRLKRLLERDEAEAGPKRQKTETEKDAKVRNVLARWRTPGEPVLKHVLDALPEPELDTFIASGYQPDFKNQWKSA